MKLYDFPFSPNSRKVRAVAYELGIALETQRVDLLTGGQRNPEYLAKNPNGRVPVLEDGDLVLWESTAIIRYLAAGTPLLADRAPGGRRGRSLDRVAARAPGAGDEQGRVREHRRSRCGTARSCASTTSCSLR